MSLLRVREASAKPSFRVRRTDHLEAPKVAIPTAVGTHLRVQHATHRDGASGGRGPCDSPHFWAFVFLTRVKSVKTKRETSQGWGPWSVIVVPFGSFWAFIV